MVVNTNSGSKTASRDVLYFTSDTVTYNEAVYYYIKNLQGDVTYIVDSSGTIVVSYTYDAWGNLLSTSGSMASTLSVVNPLRYRGYVYDSESGLYYLQSRYYDPEMGRFLNHDVVFDTDAGMQGYNLFIYCGNNPIIRIDISGADSERLDDLDLDDDQVSERGGGGSGSNRGHNRGSGNNNGGNHAGGSSGGSSDNGNILGASPNKIAGNNYAGNSGRTEIHHVVEQCQVKKSGFSNQQIQASTNKVALDYNLHRKISGYYSSIQGFTEGLRVRDWLAGQSFEAQTAFGWSVVNMFYSQFME